MKQRDHGKDAVPWGPSRLARFFAGGGAVGSAYGGGPMGGTPANSHEISVTSLYFALNNIVLPEVTAQHPNWSYGDRREEAIRKIELRSADNLRKGYLPELDREGVMTTEWDIVDTASGKKMATWNGDRYTTREELWDSFEKYAKSRDEWTEALEREKSAQHQMESAILRGDAKGAATWLSHESNLARYLQVWEREDDGRIISKQYDVGRIVGRDITQQEANRVMDNISRMYTKSSVTENTSYPHVVSKEAIHIHSISLVDGKQTVFPKEVQVSHRVSETSHLKNRIDDQLFRQNVPFDFVRDVGDQVFKNTKETVVSTGSFLERRKADKGKNLRFSEPRRSGTRDIVERVRRLFGRDEDGHEGKWQQGRLTIEKIREKPVRMVKVIETRHTEMRKGAAMLGVIAETGIAVHAAPVIIVRLIEELPTPVVATKKSIERHAKKELTRQNKELRKAKRETKKESVKVQPLRTERVEPLRRAKERKWRKKRSSENGIPPRRAAASEKIPPASKKRERREKRLMRRAVEKSARRHKKKELRMENKIQPLIEKKRSIQKKEREAVVGIVFGWMVWTLIQKEKRMDPRLRGDDRRRRGDDRRWRRDEKEEHTLWVLLSIMWYLTAIREQGMHNYPIKKKRRTLPKRGIIFSFAS